MKIVRYWDTQTGAARYGVVEGEIVRDIIGSPYDRPVKLGGSTHTLEGLRLLAPCEPTKIIMGGLNYTGHAIETNQAIPPVPAILQKPVNTLIGPDHPIEYPPETERLEYELELAVVIARRMRNVPVEEALDHVLGYTCGNDVTARDVCRDSRTGLMFSKSWDTFCPIGPWIETDLDPGNLDMTLRVSGELRQQTNTSDMIFPVPELLSYISYFTTLLPGDLILTGTPAGIGPMGIGQTCEIEISGIGVLRNPIVASPRRIAGEASKWRKSG